MADGKYPLIFLTDKGQTIDFMSPKSGRDRAKIPLRDRIVHAQKLKRKLDKVWEVFEKKKEQRKAIFIADNKNGCYIDVKGSIGADLIYKSLENIRYGIRLCNIKVEKIQEEQFTRATVFIPEKQRGYFLKRIKEYAEKETKTGKPKNKRLIESIEDIELAVIGSFWQPADDLNSIPGTNKKWCEIWLSSDKEEIFNHFKS